MRCPSCSAELEIADRQGIEVLCCPRCAGIWLNAGILEEIVGRILVADEELAGRSPANGEKLRSGGHRPHFADWKFLR